MFKEDKFDCDTHISWKKCKPGHVMHLLNLLFQDADRLNVSRCTFVIDGIDSAYVTVCGKLETYANSV